MESSVSFLSANQVLAGLGKLCFDPFCGSASLLLSAAVGSYAVGSDFESHSFSSEHSNALANFAKYNLNKKVLGFFQAGFLHDNFQVNNIDAIITDPPYGIREKVVSDCLMTLG